MKFIKDDTNMNTIEESIKKQKKRIIDVAYKARQGHLSSSMSIMEIINVLFKEVMVFDPQKPDAETNDKFVLSKGHASLALYALLNDLGCVSDDELYSFSKFDSILGEHPDRNKVPAVDVSTGSLGHGFPTAIGMAAGFKAQGKTNRVFVVIGDGEANEGSIWEAAFIADKLKLDNIVCLVDDNNSASHMNNIGGKFEAFGWEVISVNGNSIEELRSAFNYCPLKPYLIWCNTIKGYGLSLMERDPEGWHHKVISESDYEELNSELA